MERLTKVAIVNNSLSSSLVQIAENLYIQCVNFTYSVCYRLAVSFTKTDDQLQGSKCEREKRGEVQKKTVRKYTAFNLLIIIIPQGGLAESSWLMKNPIMSFN